MSDVAPAPAEPLAAAAREHRRVSFGYRAEGGDSSIRQVDPYRMVLHGGHWYQLCWDAGRRDWRTFRADRITRVRETGSDFTPREIPGDAAPVHLPENTRRLPHHRVTLSFEASLSRVGQRLGGQEAELEQLSDDRCRVLLWTSSYELTAAIVLSMGIDFGIETPEDFRSYCRGLRDRLEQAVRPG